MTRRATNAILARIDEGTLDPAETLRNLLGFMSEADVAEFAEAHELVDEPEEDDDNDDNDEEDDASDD